MKKRFFASKIYISAYTGIPLLLFIGYGVLAKASVPSELCIAVIVSESAYLSAKGSDLKIAHYALSILFGLSAVTMTYKYLTLL